MTTTDAPATEDTSPDGADPTAQAQAPSRLHGFFRDPRWALAMVRATVLEAAHPAIGAALVENSTFVAHPWRRLRNTYQSTQRMIGTDPAVREWEAARLNRMHARLQGTDAKNRPYNAMDPGARAWVVATLFESSVTMFRLSGQPLDQDFVEELYEEFRAMLAAMGDDPGLLPDTVPEFWQYFDKVVATELENTEAMRVILYRLFEHLPAPPLLSSLPTMWVAARTVAAPLVGMVAVASLPEPFRRRAGLPEIPGAQTVMQGAYLSVGLVRYLPSSWTDPDNIIEFLSAAPGSDQPAARTLAAVQSQIERAGALLRLLSPLHDQDEREAPSATTVSPAAAAQRKEAEDFFRQVLDQTGNGSLDWPDLAAMARELSSRLNLDEPQETRLYQAFADWWHELQAALDTDGDGSISAQEYAAGAPAMAGPALIRVAEVLFEATDRDGNGQIDPDEYRVLFRTTFHRDTADGNATAVTRSAFVKEFVAFMAGRKRTTPFDPLLAEA
ncbi:oxygenase MpaB family protein [Kitasatospora sp. NPDC101801]|uniref:oxygenase MpaB family protein n=1 Tax=Kitasatospora sp. NPDC101801 TaxID=3364103 RepID=UPI0037FC4AB9